MHQDFKYQITDARKIARSISAFANNSGGHLLVGVKDNGSIVGVSSDEEIYMIVAGKGSAVIDDETVELNAGDWLRIAPEAKRQFSAAEDTGISYVCIQVKAGSLEEYTADDAVIL